MPHDSAYCSVTELEFAEYMAMKATCKCIRELRSDFKILPEDAGEKHVTYMRNNIKKEMHNAIDPLVQQVADTDEDGGVTLYTSFSFVAPDQDMIDAVGRFVALKEKIEQEKGE